MMGRLVIGAAGLTMLSCLATPACAEAQLEVRAVSVEGGRDRFGR